MDNYYESNRELFEELCVEKRLYGKQFGLNLSIEHLKKAWFSITEGTGGGAESNIESEHIEERALAQIESLIKELERR